MNHRFLLRLITNLALFLLTLSCFGIVLWVIDEILGWDILPDALSLLVQDLLIAGGIIAMVLVVMNILLSLALLAEANASRAELPNFLIAPQLKRRMRNGVVIGIVAIALLMGGLQVINQIRTQSAIRSAQIEFEQAKADMDESMVEVLKLFTPPLLGAIASNTLVEQGQLGNLSKLLRSIQSSFPHQPLMVLLVAATQEPYEYAQIDANAITTRDNNELVLVPQLYTGFPSAEETEAIARLFAETLPSLDQPLQGNVLNNTTPSSWGILKHNGDIIAVVFLQATLRRFDRPFGSPPFHHKGPEQLLTN